MRLLFYTTAHGFGHASRDIEVLRHVHALSPDSRLHLRTAVAPWFLDHTLDGLPCERSQVVLDVGVRQPDGVTQDLDATLAACVELRAQRDALLQQERAFMRSFQPEVVVTDVPALPLVAASSLGIASAVLSNFTWRFIYEAFVPTHPPFAPICRDLEADYAHAGLFLRLPFHAPGDGAEIGRVDDVPMICRRSALSPEEARERLGLDPGRIPVLLSFGGLGPSPVDWTALATSTLRAYSFIVTPPFRGTAPPAGGAFVALDNADLSARGLGYADLVRACEVVVTKPGYGIVSECLANGTRVLYTSRGAFAEYPILVEALQRWGVSTFIPPRDLSAGNWGPSLERLMRSPRGGCQLAVDGATACARRLLELA